MKLCSPVLFGHIQAEYLVGCDKLISVDGYNSILVLLLLSLLQTNIYICGSSRRRSGGHKTKPAGVGQLAGNPSLCPQCVHYGWCGVVSDNFEPTLPCVHIVDSNESTMCVVCKFWTKSFLCPHSGLFFFRSPLQKIDFVSSHQRQKETCLLELFSFELAVPLQPSVWFINLYSFQYRAVGHANKIFWFKTWKRIDRDDLMEKEADIWDLCK